MPTDGGLPLMATRPTPVQRRSTAPRPLSTSCGRPTPRPRRPPRPSTASCPRPTPRPTPKSRSAPRRASPAPRPSTPRGRHARHALGHARHALQSARHALRNDRQPFRSPARPSTPPRPTVAAPVDRPATGATTGTTPVDADFTRTGALTAGAETAPAPLSSRARSGERRHFPRRRPAGIGRRLLDGTRVERTPAGTEAAPALSDDRHGRRGLRSIGADPAFHRGAGLRHDDRGADPTSVVTPGSKMTTERR